MLYTNGASLNDVAGTAPSASTAFVQSLERGLAVIRVFDAESPELTLSEVARRTGLTRATARRFLHTLVEIGYMRTDGRLFSLRPRVLELGFAYLSSLSLPQIATPHMERLVERVQETCSLAVLDAGEVVYVARVPARRRMVTIAISVGSRFPAYATSMGRVLLAGQPNGQLEEYLETTTFQAFTPRTVTDADKLRSQLNRIRRNGYALTDQELEEGIRSVAAPVRDTDGAVVAAMNLSAHTSRGSADTIRRELLPPLHNTIRLIEEDLQAFRRD